MSFSAYCVKLRLVDPNKVSQVWSHGNWFQVSKVSDDLVTYGEIV